MTTYQAQLQIDLGEVGYHDRKQPFRVCLHAKPLTELIAHAKNAHRVYELMLIDRPGDVWEYVRVKLEAVPSSVSDRVHRARDDASLTYADRHAWIEGHIPFTAFDRLFSWASDDTDPEDEAWLNHRGSPVLRTFAQQLLGVAKMAQSNLHSNDHLLRHIVAAAQTGTHDYAFLDRRVAIGKSRGCTPNDLAHTVAFYEKLEALLEDGELASVAYRADGDYRVLRMMATEQRRRANGTGHSVGHAMHLSALVNYQISNEAWTSEILFFGEGLAHGDLFVEGGGIGGNVKALFEKTRRGPIRTPSRYILSTENEGSISGYDIESGDGWVLYRKQVPHGRRRGLELIESRRQSRLGPVLQFGGEGSSLFEYDKTVVMVGDQVPDPARAVLAKVVAEWQSHGGDPVIVIFDREDVFGNAGCRNVFQLDKQHGASESVESGHLLYSLLKQHRPWIDVAIVLGAPEWVERVLANYLSQQSRIWGIWGPWVVASPGSHHLNTDLVLEGDLAEIIASAHLRAQAMRPRIL